MAGSQPCTVVSMEVLVEEDVITPMWIILKFLCSAVDRSLAVGVAQEDARIAAADFFCHMSALRHIHAGNR